MTAAATLLDALRPWIVTVSRTLARILGIDDVGLDDSYIDARSGSGASGDILRGDMRVDGASKHEKACSREKDGLELHVELRSRELSCVVDGRYSRAEDIGGGEEQQVMCTRKERAGGAKQTESSSEIRIDFWSRLDSLEQTLPPDADTYVATMSRSGLRTEPTIHLNLRSARRKV
jgi:hypothetical protein